MNKKFEFRSRIPSRIIVTLLMALGIGLRFRQLDRALGGGDENAMLLQFGYLPFDYIVTTYIEASNHVFHTILVRWMIVGFGDENELAIRFPSFFFGAACLWMIYKTARLLFHSRHVAHLALLIAALCPVHIYYSQTARGYSLIMFFSVAMVYAALKILGSRHDLKWGALLALCGFLSVYTLPTNVYFVFGLAGWVFLVLTVSSLNREFGYSQAARRRKALVFSGAFLGMGLLSFLAYLPLISQMIEVSRYDISYSKRMYGGGYFLFQLMADSVLLIFKGPLKWFLPFLIAGILWGKTRRANCRLLLPCVFFFPLLPALVTGVAGYPRNYLYNLPLFIIFLAGGLAWAGQKLSEVLPRRQGAAAYAGLVAIFACVALKIIIFEHYPSIAVPDGGLYRENVRKHSDPLDLIIIADSRNFLYARTLYMKNLNKIALLNKLDGVKMIASDFSAIEHYKAADGAEGLRIFSNLLDENRLNGWNVAKNLKIFSLTGQRPVAALPEDFEAQARWQTVAGSGRVWVEHARKAAGKHSLHLEAGTEAGFAVQAPVAGNVKFDGYALAVLLWSGYNSGAGSRGNYALSIPAVLVQDLETQQKNQLRIGKINNGIVNELQGTSAESKPQKWALNAFAGIIPPGEYSLSLRLAVLKGQSVLYDSLRLFFVELPDTQI